MASSAQHQDDVVLLMTDRLQDFRLNQIEIFPDQSLLRIAGEERHVEPKVMAVLECLANQAPAVVSRAQLLDDVWTGTVVSDEVVTRCISELRTLLGDSSKAPNYIQTVPKKGYRLLVTPTPISEPTTAAEASLEDSLPQRRPIARWWLAAAALAALAVGMYLGPKLFSTPSVEPLTEITTAGIPRNAEPTLAILPFTNLEGSQEADYFGAGLAEELVNALVNVPGLRVASRNAVAGANQLEDPLETAAQLGVDTILTGSVRRIDDRVRVSAQLINAQDGFHLWADQFEGEIGDVFRIQDDIAAAIVSALRLTLTEPIRVARISNDINALDYYLLGRHHWHERTPESLQRAVELFEQAVTADPTMAIAHSGLADAFLLLADYGDMPQDEAIRQAEPNISIALELDPDLAEAHASLGMLHLAQGEALPAQAALKEAVRLNPAYHMALMWLGSAVAMQGDVGKAHDFYERAYQLDPLHPVIIQNLAMSFATLGDYQRSQDVIDAFDRHLDEHTQITTLDLLFATETGDFHRVTELTAALENSPSTRLQQLARQALSLIYARRGDAKISQHYLDQASNAGELYYPLVIPLARHYAAAGKGSKLDALLATMTDQWRKKLRTQNFALRGILAMTQEDYVGAVDLLEQALGDRSHQTKAPSEVLLVMSHLIYAYQQLNNPDRMAYWRTEGEALIDQANSAGFGYFDYLTQLGFFFAASGDPAAATRAFRRALTRGRIAPWELAEDPRLKAVLSSQALQAVIDEAARTWPA